MKPATTNLDFFRRMKITQKPTGSHGPAGLLASDETPAAPPKETPADGDEAVRKMLVENPGVNGSTLYNMMKSQGMKVVQEGDSSSANAAALRVEESSKGWSLGSVYGEQFAKIRQNLKEGAAPLKIGEFTFRSRLIESSASDNGIGHTRFKVVLIQEGMGNLKDAYYYTRQALESAVPVFEGKKIYADHPDQVEEVTRPERSVKDVLGHFENVKLVDAEDGRAMLEAEVVIMPDEPYRWARALMIHSVEYAKKYPDKDFVGLSINAGGDAERATIDRLLEMEIPESARLKIQQAKEEGVETVKIVSAIHNAVSCDLVTEAGAGGRVLEMLEKEKEMSKKKLKENEAEKKEAAPGEEAPPAEKPKHDDEAQDRELIQKMIAEYLGDDMKDQEEVMKMAKEAYEAYREMGYEADKAVEAAGHSLKLAKHMSGKQAESEKKESEEAPKEEPKKDEEKQEEAKEACKEDEAHKESEVLKLKAEVTALRESMRAIEIEKHLEKTLRESGLPRAATSVFKEHLGAAKSTKEIDEKFKLFVETYKVAKGSETGAPFIVSSEKREGGKSAMNFADCLNT